MERIAKSIEVHCPVTTVYNQWTRFEEFPRFMEGVKKVVQLDDKRLHWVAEIGGTRNYERDTGISAHGRDRRNALIPFSAVTANSEIVQHDRSMSESPRQCENDDNDQNETQ